MRREGRKCKSRVRVKDKGLEKIKKYQFLRKEIGKLWMLFEKYAGKLNFTIRLEVIKNAALLGTAGLLPTESFGSLRTQIKGILWEL